MNPSFRGNFKTIGKVPLNIPLHIFSLTPNEEKRFTVFVQPKRLILIAIY